MLRCARHDHLILSSFLLSPGIQSLLNKLDEFGILAFSSSRKRGIAFSIIRSYIGAVF